MGEADEAHAVDEARAVDAVARRNARDGKLVPDCKKK